MNVTCPRCHRPLSTADGDFPDDVAEWEVRPALRGIVGWGDYTPFISASDTLDAAR